MNHHTHATAAVASAVSRKMFAPAVHLSRSRNGRKSANTKWGVTTMDNATDHAARIAAIQARLEAATQGRMWRTADHLKLPWVETTGNEIHTVAVPGEWVADKRITCGFIANAPADLRYLLDRVREMEADRDALEMQVCDECNGTGQYFIDGEAQPCVCVGETPTYQKLLERAEQAESDLAAAIARAEKAEAELSEARATIDLCAENIAAAALAQEVEFLRTEYDALRAEVARLGPVEYEVNNGEGYRACTVHAYQHLAENPQALWTRRRIRVVHQQEGDRHD